MLTPRHRLRLIQQQMERIWTRWQNAAAAKDRVTAREHRTKYERLERYETAILGELRRESGLEARR